MACPTVTLLFYTVPMHNPVYLRKNLFTRAFLTGLSVLSTFYARKEIKDILCYLKTINNSADDIAIKRIINIPRRGIGQTTIGRISDYAFSQEMPFYEALRRVDEIPGCTRASAKIHSFVSLIEHFRMKLRGEMYSLEDMTQELLDVTGYVRELEAKKHR